MIFAPSTKFYTFKINMTVTGAGSRGGTLKGGHHGGGAAPCAAGAAHRPGRAARVQHRAAVRSDSLTNCSNAPSTCANHLRPQSRSNTALRCVFITLPNDTRKQYAVALMLEMREDSLHLSAARTW